MRNSQIVARRFETEEKLLHSLYTILKLGEWERTSAKLVSEAVDITENTVERAVRHFAGIGLLETKLEYPGGGRIASWKLVFPMPEALVKLEAEHKRELMEGSWESTRLPTRRKNKLKSQPQLAVFDGIALAREGSEEGTRAIAGPEADNPFAVLAPLRRSESAALVEAAKQYTGKRALIAAKVKELRDGGIKVDSRAIKFERDTRLETVALVLPYIEELESHDGRYGLLRQQYRDLETAHNLLKRDYGSLQRWRDEQIAGRPRTVVGSDNEAANGRSEPAEAGAGAEDRNRS